MTLRVHRSEHHSNTNMLQHCVTPCHGNRCPDCGLHFHDVEAALAGEVHPVKGAPLPAQPGKPELFTGNEPDPNDFTEDVNASDAVEDSGEVDPAAPAKPRGRKPKAQ